MSEENHTKDLEAMLPHKCTGSVDGGKCLNRHRSKFEPYSCFHRWQAFVRATEDSQYYNWPRYENEAKDQMSEDGHPFYAGPGKLYFARLGRPQQGDWDVDWSRDNFKANCNKPYYHESHHIIPDSILQSVINKVLGGDGGSTELVLNARNMLLEQGYNINHKLNMVLLPMNPHVAQVLELPIHRQPRHPDHRAYRMLVSSRLQGDFASALKDAVDHEKPKPADLKARLEAHSELLYTPIVEGGYESLEAMAASEF
ncbi:AHH domain-containing protein [Corallococcus terminator]|uniref:Uncharacterized protein n=1 Tax=Corallococcus terminator TaxID=2316733 RepID=A0A3A8ILV1_9BACT|nr:AHH domain-containing protein [Corallococcus terminator]RKG83446.1 hypothetical protein D7V88_24095 [Corallococcus terminator]